MTHRTVDLVDTSRTDPATPIFDALVAELGLERTERDQADRAADPREAAHLT